jgi:hypothetical protein
VLKTGKIKDCYILYYLYNQLVTEIPSGIMTSVTDRKF